MKGEIPIIKQSDIVLGSVFRSVENPEMDFVIHCKSCNESNTRINYGYKRINTNLYSKYKKDNPKKVKSKCYGDKMVASNSYILKSIIRKYNMYLDRVIDIKEACFYSDDDSYAYFKKIDVSEVINKL